jgi:hypothetical protein
MVITKILSDAERNTAHGVINAHGAHGNTSVGDGLIMGHSQLAAPAAGNYDNKALRCSRMDSKMSRRRLRMRSSAGATDNTSLCNRISSESAVNTGALNAIAGSNRRQPVALGRADFRHRRFLQ